MANRTWARLVLAGSLALALLTTTQLAHAGAGKFFVKLAKEVAKDVLKDFAKELLKDVAKDALEALKERQARGQIVDGDAAMRSRVENLIRSIVDESKPFEQRVQLYADHCDLFRSGMVTRDQILQFSKQYAKQFPKQSYQLVGITNIEMTTDRKFVAVEYDITFAHVDAKGNRVSGRAHYADLIGDLDSSPHFYARKEWVQRDE